MNRDAITDAEARMEERGQTMVEYAVVLAVITITILVTIQLLGDTSGGLISRVANVLT